MTTRGGLLRGCSGGGRLLAGPGSGSECVQGESMHPRRTRLLARRWAAATAAVCAALGLTMSAGTALAAPGRGGPAAASGEIGKAAGDGRFYDAREGGTPALKRVLQHRAAAGAARPATAALRTSLGDQAVVDIDGLTGTPRQVARLDGFLTGPARGAATDIALGYLRQHLAAFGLTTPDLATLRLSRDYVDIAGIHHLSYVQRIGGEQVFGNGVKANVTADGRLIGVQGSPVAAQVAPAAAAKPAVRSGA